MTQIIGTNDGWLVALDGYRKVAARYDNGRWTDLGGNVSAIATDAGGLVAYDYYRQVAGRFVADGMPWDVLTTGVKSIASDAGQLVVLLINGAPNLYRGAQNNAGVWDHLTSSVTHVATDAGQLHVLLTNGAVNRYNGSQPVGTPGPWSHIEQGFNSIHTQYGSTIAMNPGTYQRKQYVVSEWRTMDASRYSSGTYVREPVSGEVAWLSGGMRHPLTEAYYQRNKIWERGVVAIYAPQYDAIPVGYIYT